MSMRFQKILSCLLLAGMFVTVNVQAVPVLQLYVEGATYDTDHESWVFDAVVGEAFTLWVIGNTQASNDGVISDVKLSAVYPDPIANDGGSLNISLTPTNNPGGFGGFTDPSTPTAPGAPEIISEDGENGPVMSNGQALAPHGVYIAGNEWQQFHLGDMDLMDSPIADFISSFPGTSNLMGQINAYEVLVTTNDTSVEGPFDIHFDAYDGIMAGNHMKAKFAPFSHDAGTGINEPDPDPPTSVNEPATLGLALVFAGLVAVRRQRSRSK
jgi:hypothetical protein